MRCSGLEGNEGPPDKKGGLMEQGGGNDLPNRQSSWCWGQFSEGEPRPHSARGRPSRPLGEVLSSLQSRSEREADGQCSRNTGNDC